MREPITTAELVEGSRCVLGTVVCNMFARDPMFFKDRLKVCNDCGLLGVSKLPDHRKLTLLGSY